MSSAEKAAVALTKVESYDLRILQAIELGMIRHKVVPVKEVVRYSGLNEREVEYRMKGLDELELLYRQWDPYLGYIMNYNGYDLLALNALVKAESLEALGPSIGIGKESDVFEAVTPGDVKVAVKFHRLGRTSFRDTRRKREYVADRRHISWLYQSRLAAEAEYRALKSMQEAGVSVPEPIDQNRHVIVMQFIQGTKLSDIISLDEPRLFLDDILEDVRLAYKAGVIHTDLSEYNILVDGDGEVWIIDWPQYTSTDHPNAMELLERDVGNVVYYFKRKHGLEYDPEQALSHVRG
ncbi:serine/threonine protein phosphatase [Candidatus Bathyarchaeota archaeon]|nr:serine/threonine protein phosphatase [Candidatus Bathyarchaeota archaeon]